MSTLEVNTINPQSGNDITLGGSSKNVKFASGTTIDFNTNTPTLTLGSAMKMGPAFHVAKSGNQDIPDDTTTKVTGWTEVLDTDNCFASDRFTPTTAGKYLIYGAACVGSVSTITNLRAAYSFIYKNGSSYAVSDNNYNGSFIYNATLFVQAVVDFNGSSDYVELYANGDLTTGNPRVYAVNATVFGGYKIIGA